MTSPRSLPSQPPGDAVGDPVGRPVRGRARVRGRTIGVVILAAVAVLVLSGCQKVHSLVDAGQATPGEPVIALTFDDGPGPDTPALLDLLDRKGVKATFFVVGTQVQRYPQYFDEIVRRGHRIGNHTWNHPDLTRRGDGEIVDQIVRTNELLASRGVTTSCVRPPYGATNERVENAIRSVGASSIILWTKNPNDYLRPAPRVIADRMMTGMKPGDIVVLHDGPVSRQRTVAAVDQFIDRARAAGYEFRPVC